MTMENSPPGSIFRNDHECSTNTAIAAWLLTSVTPIERIASAMAPDGWLMLGAGETVIGQTNKLGSDVDVNYLMHFQRAS